MRRTLVLLTLWMGLAGATVKVQSRQKRTARLENRLKDCTGMMVEGEKEKKPATVVSETSTMGRDISAMAWCRAGM